MTPEEMMEAHGLLHELWGLRGEYDLKIKRKWGRLQELMGTAFDELLGGGGGWLAEAHKRIDRKR